MQHQYKQGLDRNAEKIAEYQRLHLKTTRESQQWKIKSERASQYEKEIESLRSEFAQKDQAMARHVQQLSSEVAQRDRVQEQRVSQQQAEVIHLTQQLGSVEHQARLQASTMGGAHPPAPPSQQHTGTSSWM
eukprot:2961785-Amphidinium_carterae.1